MDLAYPTLSALRTLNAADSAAKKEDIQQWLSYFILFSLLSVLENAENILL